MEEYWSPKPAVIGSNPVSPVESLYILGRFKGTILLI